MVGGPADFPQTSPRMFSTGDPAGGPRTTASRAPAPPTLETTRTWVAALTRVKSASKASRNVPVPPTACAEPTVTRFGTDIRHHVTVAGAVAARGLAPSVEAGGQ